MRIRLFILATNLFSSFVDINSNEQHLFSRLVGGNVANRIKRQDSNTCESILEVIGCSRDSSHALSRREENKIEARYKAGDKCDDIASVTYEWVFLFENGTQANFDKDVVIIKPYTIGTGEHAIALYLTETHKNSTKSIVTADCTFRVRPEKPIPQIKGGSEITANSGENLEISGKDSVDMDVPPGQPGNLEFKWECTATGHETDYCTKDLGTKSSITIPGSKAIDGTTYTITLFVRASKNSDWETAKQIVHFKSDVSTIQIRCLKNCPPIAQKTNRKNHIILQAVCVKYCKDLNKDLYEWSIDSPNFDYDANTQGGRNRDIFHIIENVLQPGNEYLVKVSVKGIVEGSSIKLKVHVPPKLNSCSITPSSGESLKTKFTANCQYPPGDYMFEIYSTHDDIDVVIKRGVKLEELSFVLGPGSKAKVKIIDSYRFTDEKPLAVSVASLLKTSGSEEDLEKDILDKYFNRSSDISIYTLMETKKFEKVLEVFNSLADEMNNLKKTGKVMIAKKYHSVILNYVDSMPMETGTRALQLGALATKITEGYNSKPDPEIAALGTKICKKSGDKMLNYMKHKRFPDSFSEESRESANTLSKCSQAGVEPNLDVLKPEVGAPEVTTPFPLVNFPAIIEDYPDYVDDQNTSKAMNKYDESSSNLIKICFVNSRKMALTMSTEEQTMFFESSFFNLTSTLRVGNDILGAKIESHKITLVPSRDFSKTKSAVHIAMCTSTRNIFWWTQKEEIFTSIAIIQFTVKGISISHFNKPFILTFETNSNISSTIKSHESTTPKTPASNVPEIEDDFEKMSIHRIDVYSKQSFVIEFMDLPESVILDVVVADFHKPNYREFQMEASQIDKHNNKLFIFNNQRYDGWYYLAALPSSKMINRSAQYKFSVYTLSCFRWAEPEAKWMFACGSTKNSSINLIICECYHSSALVAMLVNNKVRAEETLIEEFELETQASYIIITSVVVIFFLYCVFLTWFSVHASEEVSERGIYFLSDVPSSYRYGYLLIVRTGNKSNAGTTSNVTLKVYGTKSESKEHVLNYPDPEKKFLHKNEEDWFFLATEFYLGDIEKIDIWFDYLGFRPAWFCSEIEIFDIQLNKYWLFEINKWFEILKNEEMVHTAFPVKPDESKKKKVVALRLLKHFFTGFRGPHMWNLMRYEKQAISRMKRLHVIYSIFLTTYVMGLYLYGCPKLENSDSLSYSLSYGVDKYVVLITIGCFVLTFAIHFPIVWFFRYPKDNILGKYQKILKEHPIDSNFLCWFFLITNIVISMTLLIILGFWVPYVTGLLWLTSILVSLLVYIVIMENIMRLFVNFMSNQRLRVQRIFEYIKSSLVTVENQRAMLYKIFGGVVLRPLFGHLYKPLDPLKIKQQRYWASIKEKLWEILEDLVLITVYVTLLYLVILMDKDEMVYLSHVEVEDLIKGTHSRTALLEDVFHRKEMEDYINNTLIFSMQSLQWYGKYVAKNPGMTIDNTNKYLGIVRLRQHRTYNVSCDVDFVNRSCHPSYFWHSERKNFSEGWMKDQLSNRFARMDTVWDYISEWKAGTFKFVGTFAIYSGGGYISTLGRTMQNSLINLNYLLRNSWIDDLSRCIFIEFLLYNPCTNLFSSVRIQFEISATGYIEQKLDVHTARLLFVKEETDAMVWIVFTSFITMLNILIVKLTYRLVRKRKLVLKDTWNAVDITIVIMSLTCLVLYVARSKVISKFLSRIEKARNNEFVKYFHLLYAEGSLTTVAAVLVFLSTLRLWKLMRFMRIVKIVEKTLLLSAFPLLGMLLYQLIFVLACTFHGFMRYSDHSYDFRDIPNTISTMFIISLNFKKDFDFKAITGFGYIYYSIFMIVMLVIYTLYIAIITICYVEARFYYSHEEEYNVVDYIKEQCQYYSELIKVRWKNLRLRGGTDKNPLDRKVYPKPDEFRYAKCVTLSASKMDGMTCAAKCILRNIKKERKMMITDKDADMIKQTLVGLFRKDTAEKEVFFISNVVDEKIKFVDDKVMLKMERIVEAFLTRDEEKLENERRRKLYRKIVESHEKKMGDMADTLNVLLNLLNVVDIDI